MIAKDKATIIERALDSTQGVFDGYFLQDTGSSDNTVEVFEAWCKKNNKPFKTSKKFVGKDYKSVVVDGKELLGDFGSARNDSFALAKGYDYAFWFDTDDVIVNAYNIPSILDRVHKDNTDLVLMTYVYAKSADGLKPVVQKRERIINLKKEGGWKNRVHETYEIQGEVRIAETNDIVIEHLRTPFEAIGTSRRNNLIMKAQLAEEGIENFNDQMLHSLAFDHWEHREFEQSIKYYKILLNRYKGRPVSELVYNVLLKVAYAYLSLNKVEKAIVYALRAKQLGRGLAEPLITLAQAYASIENWEEAAMYARDILRIGMPNTTAPINEYDFVVLPRKILEKYHLIRGEFEQAKQYAKEVSSISPQPQHKRDVHAIFYDNLTNEAIRGVLSLAKYVQSTNDLEMYDRVKTAIPLNLKDNPTVRGVIKELSSDFNRKSRKVKLEGSKSIVVYAGPHYEPWDGNSDKEKGIGGSEGMCIQLMRELAALGNKVFVYNECGEADEQEIDGVTYRHHSKWNANVKCDVFISLRNPYIFNQIIKAKKQFLWLHDTEYGDQLEPINFYSPNKTIILSDAHKQVIKDNHGIVDDSIFWKTRNGVNRFAVEYAKKNAGKRNPYQVIYASSYDRGLDHVLEMWPKIKEAVPQATLKIFYGWNTYDAMMQQRLGTPHGNYMKQYKERIVRMLTALAPLGVEECGRVSQNELYKNYMESGVWFYPTEFYEISCINAMTAQVMGAIPVCTPYAALQETVNGDYGIKADLNELTEAMIYLLSNPEEAESRRKNMMKWAEKAFDMKSLAKDWDLFFNEV